MTTDGTIIELKNCEILQNKNLILSDVTLTINRGEFVYLIGKTGTGKSTLLKMLYGEIPLKEGEATVAGFNLKKLPQKKVPYLRRKLGMIFQDFQLLPDRSANDNLKFVLKATGWKNKNEINERIQQVMERAGLATKGYKMPHQLSGGEQQRLVIARALVNDPEIIFADEPTGNLDPETSTEVLRLLRDISTSGRTVVMATHNYPMMEKFPGRTIRFEGGKVYSTLTVA